MAIKAVLGIDLWHAVEFSSYGCALEKLAKNANFSRAASKPITTLSVRSNSRIRICPASESVLEIWGSAVRPEFDLFIESSPFHCKGMNYRGMQEIRSNWS